MIGCPVGLIGYGTVPHMTQVLLFAKVHRQFFAAKIKDPLAQSMGENWRLTLWTDVHTKAVPFEMLVMN